jgi:hypothetical protein
MKTLVSIPDDIIERVEDHKETYYPDLTIPKMLVRLLVEEMERRGKEQ